MLQQEFEERTNLKVSHKEYEVIEDIYYNEECGDNNVKKKSKPIQIKKLWKR